MKKSIFIFSLFILPLSTQAASLQTSLTGLTGFLSTTVIPFLLGIAFLFFIINAVRYFIFESTNEDGRENAKNLAIYSVLAFVLIIIFWGIINMLTGSTGLGGTTQPKQDYVEMKKP